MACQFGYSSCVREILKDFRVKANEPNNDGETPFWAAAWFGHLDIIKWWIASGRGIDLGKAGDDQTDAIGGAKNNGKTEVVPLLERFKENPMETRYSMRVELGLLDELAAKMFALVVFVSDGLLQSNSTTPSPAARFFSIAAQLPLELQMVLCFRQVGSEGNHPRQRQRVGIQGTGKETVVIPMEAMPTSPPSAYFPFTCFFSFLFFFFLTSRCAFSVQ